MEDIRRLRAEVSIYRKKIRSGGRIFKYLRTVHNIRLNVDRVDWEPIGGSLALVSATDVPPEPVPAMDPPVR